jgi:hypothetical protein
VLYYRRKKYKRAGKKKTKNRRVYTMMAYIFFLRATRATINSEYAKAFISLAFLIRR